jgi:hypothetical protein
MSTQRGRTIAAVNQRLRELRSRGVGVDVDVAHEKLRSGATTTWAAENVLPDAAGAGRRGNLGGGALALRTRTCGRRT